ncbi:hypothetical protein Tco_0816045 [Tanacetum coccineum]
MESRRRNRLIQMVDDNHCMLDLKSPERYPNGKGIVRATSKDSIWHYTGRELGRSADNKGVVHAMSRGLDMASHWLGVGAAPLMSPRQDETSEPLLYAGGMAGPYRCKDITRGQNDNPVTSGIRAKVHNIALDGSQKGNGLIQMVDDLRCMLDARKSNGLILDRV